MKYLILLLLVLGGATTFASSKIRDKFFKSDDEETKLKQGIIIKSAGFALVIIATVLAFFA